MFDAVKVIQAKNNFPTLIRKSWDAAELELAAERKNNGTPKNSFGPTILRAKDCLEYLGSCLYEGHPTDAVSAIVYVVNCAKDHEALQLVVNRIGSCVDTMLEIESEKPGFFKEFEKTLLPLINGNDAVRGPSNGPRYVLNEMRRQMEIMTPKAPGSDGNGRKAVSHIIFVPK